MNTILKELGMGSAFRSTTIFHPGPKALPGIRILTILEAGV
jgi:hypothetical protein